MTSMKKMCIRDRFFIANFGLNYYQSASIIFCNTVVASVAQPVLGYVADRWRVPWFIPVGFSVTLVSISVIAIATSYEMILALSLLAGVGAALFHPEAALLVNRTQSHELGNAMEMCIRDSSSCILCLFLCHNN